MTQKVVFTRTRTIQEKIEVPVSATDPEDAIAIAKHMIEGADSDWRYKKTVEASDPSVEVVIVKK